MPEQVSDAKGVAHGQRPIQRDHGSGKTERHRALEFLEEFCLDRGVGLGTQRVAMGIVVAGELLLEGGTATRDGDAHPFCVCCVRVGSFKKNLTQKKNDGVGQHCWALGQRLARELGVVYGE